MSQNKPYTFLVAFETELSSGNIKIDTKNPSIEEEDLVTIQEEIRSKMDTSYDGPINIINILPLPIFHSSIL